MEITISGKDRKRLKQVEDLAKKLGLNISQKRAEPQRTREEKRQQKAVKAMGNLVKIGAFKDIKDPVAWQREQRKDRDIGRDE